LAASAISKANRKKNLLEERRGIQRGGALESRKEVAERISRNCTEDRGWGGARVRRLGEKARKERWGRGVSWGEHYTRKNDRRSL